MAHRACAQWSVSTPTPTGQRKGILSEQKQLPSLYFLLFFLLDHMCACDVMHPHIKGDTHPSQDFRIDYFQTACVYQVHSLWFLLKGMRLFITPTEDIC